jgi:PIN domain nuclease of toxin-antitoxin system
MARAPKPRLIHLDTHVVMWLYDGLVDRLSERVCRTIEIAPLYISPMAKLELQFLHEIGRIRPTAKGVVDTLVGELGLQQSNIPFSKTIEYAHGLDWTRDPFDRVIVAEAMAAGAHLVSKDCTILQNSAIAVW